MDFKDAEFVYKSTLVYTASSPRLILLLYNKMLVELKKVMVFEVTHKREAMHSLNHAYKVLTELLSIFAATPEPIYQEMYLSHTPLADRISKMFVTQEIDQGALHDIMDLTAQYRDAWKKALNIRDRRSPQQKRKRPLNVRPPQTEPPPEQP